MSNDVIDARICPYCNKPMPNDMHYRETCGKPECQVEHKRHQQRERLAKKREENKLLEYDRNTTNGTITLSIDELRRLILDTAKEVRTETEANIYNRTAQIFDIRFMELEKRDAARDATFQKMLENISQPPTSETSVKAIPIEEPLLKDVNKEQLRVIEKLLDELHEITGEKKFNRFINHFKISYHDQLKAKDGNRAEKWVKARILEAKQNTHRSMAEYMPPDYDRREIA